MKTIILPGLDGSADLRRDFADSLPYDASTISYPTDKELSYQALSHFVGSKLPREEDFVLIAESFSGPVAARLGARQLNNLKAIVFVASFVKRPLPVPEQLLAFLDRAPLHSERMLRLARPFTFGRWGNGWLDAALLEEILELPESLIRFRLTQALTVDAMEKYRKIKTPMLYIRPKQDRVVWSPASVDMEAANPNLSIETVKGPHFLLQARPDAAAKTVAEFVEHLQVQA